MTIKRTKTKRFGVATLFNSSTGETSFINPDSSGLIFNRGYSYSSWDSADYGISYGEWLLVPNETFDAEVKMWGAGGGAHNTSGGAAGGGGYARADIKFISNKPYVIWVGEGGFYSHHNYDTNGNRGVLRSGSSFGGGGGAGHNGGTGGGCSGLFFDAVPTNGGPGHGYSAIATSFRSSGQPTALLVAGGGGGAGHHGTTQHGQGAGGGGQIAGVGHAQSPANQDNAGHRWNASTNGSEGWEFQGGFGGANSYTGGGGGGWYGGPGGTHQAGHHNGGGGGSGHALDLYSQPRHPNYWIKQNYPDIVSRGYLEASPGTHQNHNPAPAAISDSDYVNYVGFGSGNSATYTPTTSGNNGKVLVRLK